MSDYYFFLTTLLILTAKNIIYAATINKAITSRTSLKNLKFICKLFQNIIPDYKNWNNNIKKYII